LLLVEIWIAGVGARWDCAGWQKVVFTVQHYSNL
jgi:hypothetical protein